jgi:hypothetical protein
MKAYGRVGGKVPHSLIFTEYARIVPDMWRMGKILNAAPNKTFVGWSIVSDSVGLNISATFSHKHQSLKQKK